MTAVDRFTVHTEHPWSPRGWVRVVVYTDVRTLRADAARYSRDVDHDETEACFQGHGFSVRLDDDGRVEIPAHRYAGVLRIQQQHGVATLAHEATHAAAAMYLRQHSGVLDLTAEDSMNDEEVLCYAVGDLVGGISQAMQTRGHWPALATPEDNR